MSKVIVNKFIPFKGFLAINLFGVIFVRSDAVKKLDGVNIWTMLNHERIHTKQMREMGYIFFYIWYFLEWLVRLVINGKKAYENIVFEREAYNNEYMQNYNVERKHFAWFKYYGKKYKVE